MKRGSGTAAVLLMSSVVSIGYRAGA
jgi:hypothetical protein